MTRELPNRVQAPIAIVDAFTRGERRIVKSLESPVPPAVLEAYAQYESFIKNLYGDKIPTTNLLFHGTGKMQYRESGERDSGVTDAFSEILTNGLQPKKDIWVNTPGSLPTVSFTSERFYAKWYSQRFQNAQEKLKWEYGDSSDWFMQYALNLLSGSPTEFSIIFRRTLFRSHARDNGYQPFQNWFKSARNDVTPRSKYMDLVRGKSTIEGNFGIILVYKQEDVPTIDLPLISHLEKRSMVPVSGKHLKAIEVPLDKVEEVENLCREKGVQAMVVPIECVDYHMSKQQNLRKRRRKNLTPKDETAEKVVSKKEIEAAASGKFNVDYHPQTLLDVLEQDSILREQFRKKVNIEGYDLKYHTLSVLSQFEKYFSDKRIPSNVRIEFFRVFLAIHDIGKGVAQNNKDSVNQGHYNTRIAVDFLSRVGYGEAEINLATALLSSDALGNYLRKVGTSLIMIEKIPSGDNILKRRLVKRMLMHEKRTTQAEIKKMAEIAGMSTKDFYKILLIYHQVDAGSYTSDGGAMKTLDYVFRFNPESSEMSYAPVLNRALQQFEEDLSQEELLIGTKGLEISRANYEKAATTMALITEHITGLTLPLDVMERWQAGFRLMRIGDSILDNLKTAEERVQFGEGIVAFLREQTDSIPYDSNILGAELRRVRDLGKEVNFDRREKMFQTFAELLQATEGIKNATSVSEMAQLLRIEGEKTITLFLCLLPTSFEKNPSYPKLEKILLAIGSLGNVFDTVVDLPSDYKNGISKIPPTFRNRMGLFLRIVPGVASVAISIRPNTELVKNIVSDVSVVTQNTTNKVR